jgi:hypothetical protein
MLLEKPMAIEPPNAIPASSSASVAERRAICREALALAQRAADVGLPTAAFLLDTAALEIGGEFGLFDCLRQPRGRADR